MNGADDEASSFDEVSSFYDAHPYPPPVADLDGEAEPWADGRRRRVEHARLWPTVPYRDDHAILVAGCGSFQAARYAIHYPHASVVGVDVSPASLEATRRLVERHELAGVELHQLPIEEVGSLGRSFDHVVCTGVLHHLADPAAGLRALRDSLVAGGAIHLMVYATHGRFGIELMQEYCRRLGVTPTAGEIGDLVQTLRELPSGHAMGDLLRNSPDFQDDDALADALLNPRDRSYTVPEVRDLLDRASLRLARWFRQAPYRPQCGAMTEVPHGVRIAAMPEWDQFAAMELFRGTMLRHNVVAHRDDSPLPDPPLHFDGDDWRTYVPVVPPTVVTVEDRLPPKVAAVLINRAHVDRDLVLFVDAAARRIFESIDGTTPFGDIDGSSADLLRRLWWHDLVMIDASGAR